MKTVALTGGIGSGKSAVCRILAQRGIPVYDCDSAAKRLYDSEPSLVDSLEGLFGCSLRGADGRLDRGRLAGIIFTSQDRLAELEEIVHPAVLRDFLHWRERMEERFHGAPPDPAFYGHRPFVVMESAIVLSKPAFLEVVDRVVLVDASEEVRIGRVCLRDGTMPEKVRQRMALQSFDERLVNAVIRNDGTESALETAAADAFSSIVL